MNHCRRSKRALRRHHRERLKKKRASYYWWWASSDAKRLGKVVTTPCMCSCFMCGNPRKYYKMTGEGRLTIQERKYFQESIEENMDEV